MVIALKLVKLLLDGPPLLLGVHICAAGAKVYTNGTARFSVGSTERGVGARVGDIKSKIYSMSVQGVSFKSCQY